MLRKMLATATAVSLLMSGSSAVAQSAQSLSLADSPTVRASANVEGENQMAGDYTIYVIGAIVLGLAIWGIIELTGDDDETVSP